MRGSLWARGYESPRVHASFLQLTKLFLLLQILFCLNMNFQLLLRFVLLYLNYVS